MPTLEEMRAEINRLLPEFETPQFVKNIQTAYQNMPGSQLVRPIAETAATFGTGIASLVPSTLYGVGKGIQAGEFGTSTKTAQQEAMKAMRAMTYEPRTEAGKSMVETLESLPRKITGSHMGIGMLPELMVMPPRISPSDVQVMGARGINAAREIADIPRDFSAAQSGLTRIGAFDKPTYGARLQAVAEDVGDVLARRQARRSDEGGTSLPKMDVLTDFVTDMNMYAVKPKGGNWVTNLGSTLPLSEQRMMGKRLAQDQINLTGEKPIETLFENQLNLYDTKNKTRLKQEFLKHYLDNPDMGSNQIDQIKSFIFEKNLDLKEQDLPLLPTLDRIEKAIAPYNQWVMGPYQKYMQNQMGTGLPTDPLLAVINQAEIPLHSLFPTARERDSIDPDLAERVRKNALERLKLDDVDLTKPQYQNVGKVTATTPVGREYENYLDAEISATAPIMIDKEKFPFAEKLDPYSILYDVAFSRPDEKTGLPDIKNYVLEGLMSGKYDLNKVSNLPPHVIVQDMIKDYQGKLKEEQKNKELMETYRHERAKQLQVDTEFPDGSRMVVFNKASYDANPVMLKRDFGQITKDLNQCIGAGCHNTPDYRDRHGPALEPHTGRPPRGSTGELGHRSYYDMVRDGRGEIVSLIDPNDKYQFTIQLKYQRQALTSDEEKTIAQSWLTQNAPETLPKFLSVVQERGNGPAIAAALKSFPEIKDAIIASQFTKKDIAQMRGADNGNAPEMYEYLIIDWLNKNADQLGDISDLEMIPNIIDLNRTPAHVADKLSEYEPDWDLETLRDFVEQIKEEKALPRFFDGGDASYLAEQRGIDLAEPPIKELGKWDRETVLEEFDRHILGKPDSLYDQDNLQEKFVNDINLLRGYPVKYDLPVDIHRKVVKMILSEDQSLVNSVATQIKNYINDGNRYGEEDLPLFGLTGRQISSVHNILNNWYNRHPRKQNPIIWDSYPDDVQKHPNPFDEVKLKEDLPRPNNVDLIKRDVESFLQGGNFPLRYDTPQVNEDIAILIGDESLEATIPVNIHLRIVRALLDQDDNTTKIRNSINRLVAGEEIHGLSTAQRTNLFNILTQWVERYPLND